jgi:hypothetical protein
VPFQTEKSPGRRFSALFNIDSARPSGVPALSALFPILRPIGNPRDDHQKVNSVMTIRKYGGALLAARILSSPAPKGRHVKARHGSAENVEKLERVR